jgi:hypothetical protein
VTAAVRTIPWDGTAHLVEVTTRGELTVDDEGFASVDTTRETFLRWPKPAELVQWLEGAVASVVVDDDGTKRLSVKTDGSPVPAEILLALREMRGVLVAAIEAREAKTHVLARCAVCGQVLFRKHGDGEKKCAMTRHCPGTTKGTWKQPTFVEGAWVLQRMWVRAPAKLKGVHSLASWTYVPAAEASTNYIDAPNKPERAPKQRKTKNRS